MQISILLYLIINTIVSRVNADLESRHEVACNKSYIRSILKSEPSKQDTQKYNLFIKNEVIIQNLKPFWKSTGLCPPDPHEESYKFLLSPDMKLNIFHIGSLPHNAISQVRIHWLLDLVQLRFSHFKVNYDFRRLDKLIYLLWENDLKPGFELMGNPSSYFTDFENETQVYLWKDLINRLAVHYIDMFGIDYVMKWNFETWNEPDHHDFDKLNFTIQGKLYLF